MEASLSKWHTISLPSSGLTVRMAELRPSELLTAMKLAGNDDSQAVRTRKVTREATRMAIREVNGRPLNHDEVAEVWAQWSPRQRTGLTKAWSQLHLPTVDELGEVERSMVVEAGDDEERWTVRLGGRAIVLAQQDEETVDAALRAAEASSRSEAAQGFAATIEGVRRALRSVDGAAFRGGDVSARRWDELFSVRETYLLGHVFAQLHGTEEVVLGEG